MPYFLHDSSWHLALLHTLISDFSSSVPSWPNCWRFRSTYNCEKLTDIFKLTGKRGASSLSSCHPCSCEDSPSSWKTNSPLAGILSWASTIGHPSQSLKLTWRYWTIGQLIPPYGRWNRRSSTLGMCSPWCATRCRPATRARLPLCSGHHLF